MIGDSSAISIFYDCHRDIGSGEQVDKKGFFDLKTFKSVIKAEIAHPSEQFE